MKRQMRPVILALCALFVAAATLFAAGKPKAVVVEPIKDAGTVSKGDKISHDFLIKNEGDADLEIINVQPACGCTVAEFDKTIAPGKTGKVHAVVDTASFTGPISKGLTVYTSDPDVPQLELTVRAKVQPYISAKPGYARYITVQGEAAQGSIGQTLWAPDGTSFDVVKVESPLPYLKTSFREATPEERIADAKGKQWRVEITLSNDAQVGALADYVTIHTNHPKQKLVQIPVSGFVRPVMAVTPPVADFGKVDLKEPLRKALNVRNFATEPIKITGLDESLAGVEAQVSPVEDGREYEVFLTLKPELGKGPFNGKLMIRTDSPKTPLIEVELKGTVL
ncbi:MAG TPA: DUF1573 domain-containing protein [Thermoanaerobaculia bacterium]|nr:DUF1573 domain-containing protein [Thermoanaerobaculia bacterium]